ncbi:hypothetical protein BJX68DRAFT_253069 [Aspergillus pseudodeflectus]|uniref:FAD-binding PCMH-type domain-containing protein n=1 Tax=Aspergillus pseudodeflectus TaxID=176178 RepID=A0ABR4KZ54_9EURO
MVRAFISLVSVATVFLSSGGITATTNATGAPPCDLLIEAGLGDRVRFPSDPEFELRIQSYWALDTRRRPWCLFMPHNATEVSMGLVALLQGTDNVHRGAGDWHIAVRGGGHTLGHTNNIEDGVTIDLFYLNDITYDPATNLASVMPGSLWREVYPVLHTYGVVVAGGRDGGVGVPGILLGGGSNYYMGEHGFGCDTVRNYEVVLADGSIVNANEDEHRDLWRALKGGGINFGIVTRFDMEAIPDIPLSYGMRTMPGNASEQFVDAVVDYTDIQQQAFPKDALIALIFNIPGVEVLATAEVNTAGVLNSPGFDRFARIPQLTPFTPVATNLYALAQVTSLPGGSWSLIETLAFKTSRQMLNYVVERNRQLVADVGLAIGPASFFSNLIYQALPSFFADISEDQGGNMFADTLRGHNAVLCTIELMVTTTQRDHAVASAMFRQFAGDIRSYSVAIGADHPLVYLNYADPAQDPLGSYPRRHIKHMRKTARRYDPEGLFQTRFPGGFKISRVRK